LNIDFNILQHKRLTHSLNYQLNWQLNNVQKLSNYQNELSKCGGHKSTHFQEQIKADKKFNCTFLNRHNILCMQPFNVNTDNLCRTI
jgi:hypothetical protein